MALPVASKKSIGAAWLTALTGSGPTTANGRPDIRSESHVDLERFMGDWYVIANIPTFLEKEAYNAKERYELDDDGTVRTTFSFSKGGFDGERKQYRSRGFILDQASNAIWGMRFVWPLKSDYRIVYVNDDYSQTIIGRNKRDFAWIMARTSSISEQDFFTLAQVIREQGYDPAKLRLVPQQRDTQPAAAPLRQPSRRGNAAGSCAIASAPACSSSAVVP